MYAIKYKVRIEKRVSACLYFKRRIKRPEGNFKNIIFKLLK